MTITARRYRLARRLVRAVAVLSLWKRKAAVETMLRALFGDVVEADGQLLAVDRRDCAVGARLRRRGVWSAGETALCKRELRPGMTVLDVGANIGYFTLLFARLVGETGHVYAFEPEPNNFALLEQNVRRNGHTNVTAIAKAVGRCAGTQRLYKNPDNLGDHRLWPDADGRAWIEVPVVTLAEILPGHARVDFIKMDIQGAELAALEGARPLLGANAPLSLMTEFWPRGMRACGDDPEAYLHALRGLGFTLWEIEPGRRLRLSPLVERADLRLLCERDQEVNLFCRRA